jgi:RNA polymerase sigma factor (sigma-70 family)
MESVKAMEKLKDLDMVELIKVTFDKTEMLLAMKVLYERYTGLVHKMKHKLWQIAKDNKLNVDIDDYEQEAFFRFVGALKTCRLNELLARTDTWSFYYVYWGYLSSLNRNILNRARKEKNNVATDIVLFDDGDETSRIDDNEALKGSPVENGYEENEQKLALSEAIHLCLTKHFTPYQRQIWELKEKGSKTTLIAEETKLPQKIIKEELSKMKETLRVVLQKQADDAGIMSKYLGVLSTPELT